MRNMVPLFDAPPPIVPPYRFPSFPSTSEVGFDPSAQSDAEQKLCNSLNSPNLLILKITPAPRAPLLAVAPYRNPSLPSTRLPTGKLPLLKFPFASAAKVSKSVNCPLGEILYTVPPSFAFWAPPRVAVP